MTSTVLSEDRGAVRVLTLSRPDKLNAINGALNADLSAALAAADADDNVTAVVLTGSPRAFSAGADMKEAQSHAGRSHRARIQVSGASTALYEAIMGIDKPVIAAVNGYALGGGCALVMASDIVVAGETAIFGYPEVKRGLAATAVSPTLVAQIGRKWASELLLLCENISAQRAAEIGLVNRVVPDADVIEAAVAMAQTLAGFSQDALWMTKRMIRRSADLSLTQAHGLARDSMLVMRGFELERD
jgi:enoyl-CoA hydratase/carnithine racemase